MSGRVHRPPIPAQWRSFFFRISVLMCVVATTVVVMYLEGGLVDMQTGEAPGFLDSLYFTMVTITTVGYGDIVPVSTFARMADTFFLTPMRFIFFILFVGIAYELSFKRLQEAYKMKRVAGKLNEHTIICGFGETGHVAAEQLLEQGIPENEIVVLDTHEEALDEASKLDVIAVFGDATREKVLKSVAIERAKYVLVCPGRDDTAVLAALTIRDLNPHAHLVVMCHEMENVRLVERTGADTIVSPAGGYMMAAATRRPHLVATMKDLLEIGGTQRLVERRVAAGEVGKEPAELPDAVVVRVYRDGDFFNVDNFPTLKAGDVLVSVVSAEAEDGPKGNPEPVKGI